MYKIMQISSAMRAIWSMRTNVAILLIIIKIMAPIPGVPWVFFPFFFLAGLLAGLFAGLH
jgi:hypothetical protein